MNNPNEISALASFDKFDGIGPHLETIETRARIGERYLEAYESALSDPLLAHYMPADCPSELLLDLLNRLSTLQAERLVLREALKSSKLKQSGSSNHGCAVHVEFPGPGKHEKAERLLAALQALNPEGGNHAS